MIYLLIFSLSENLLSKMTSLPPSDFKEKDNDENIESIGKRD